MPILSNYIMTMMTNKKIALIEDDAALREILSEHFKKNGFEVDGAESGFDIVPSIFKRKPSLIVVDLNLPGVSGKEVIKSFKAQGVVDNIPVILISAQSEPEVREAALAMGAVAYFLKPLDMGKFMAAVESYAKVHSA